MTIVRLSVGLVVAAVFAVGCASSADSEPATGESAAALSGSCDMVKCATPMCATGQHLAYQGSCCATCVGPEPRCADVMCPMLMCAIGEELVVPKGQCCGRCMKAPPVKECTTDADCPSYQCFACPCPVSSCVGRTCRTTTPDASTCTGTL